MYDDLLIIYTDGTEHVVRNVSDYRYDKDANAFIFEKNKRKGFIPREEVSFFWDCL